MTVNRAICDQCRGVKPPTIPAPVESVWLCLNADKERKNLIQLAENSNPPEGCPHFFEHAVAKGSEDAK
jgi:hypothetical protein